MRVAMVMEFRQVQRQSFVVGRIKAIQVLLINFFRNAFIFEVSVIGLWLVEFQDGGSVRRLGITVSSRTERSQHRNKAIALERLRGKLEERNRRPKPRRPTKVSKAQRQKRLDDKKRRGRVKEKRKPPEPDRES